MILKPANPSAVKRRRSAFTLAEVLAALLLMAMVIPVAMQGLRVASTAGEVGQRKMVAARIGNKVLNEFKVTSQSQSIGQSGTAQDRGLNYRWTVKSEGWTGDTQSQMTVATVTVSFAVQGKNYDVHLSTLMAQQQQQTSTVNPGIY